MDQVKIGQFLKELRKEKNLTQEELGEILNVSRRTVTRWETGSNMPDLSILVDIADYYKVDLREIFAGERKDKKMDKELEQTVKQVAEYSNIEKTKTVKVVIIYLVFGIVALLINQILTFVEIGESFWVGFLKGSTAALALLSLVFALLFVTGKLTKLQNAKKRILEKV